MGLPDEAIDAYLAKDAKESGDDQIEVLDENWNAVIVYKCCHWDTEQQFMVGMGGGASTRYYLGISSSEIESSARILDVHCDEELLVKVRFLAAEAREILNGS